MQYHKMLLISPGLIQVHKGVCVANTNYYDKEVGQFCVLRLNYCFSGALACLYLHEEGGTTRITFSLSPHCWACDKEGL